MGKTPFQLQENSSDLAKHVRKCASLLHSLYKKTTVNTLSKYKKQSVMVFLKYLFKTASTLSRNFTALHPAATT